MKTKGVKVKDRQKLRKRFDNDLALKHVLIKVIDHNC